METKKWWYSRTIWLAFAQFLVGGFMALGSAHPELGWLLVLKSCLDGVLRINTYKTIE